jgi:hypothetical protein
MCYRQAEAAGVEGGVDGQAEEVRQENVAARHGRACVLHRRSMAARSSAACAAAHVRKCQEYRAVHVRAGNPKGGIGGGGGA